ncbi:MAG: hypothetical protein M1834_002744 [Cirrosporium novae-zelandiae]|nr:MAG: hypothetical protein M1834_002744 [Cirrosporium novae-zelandiae]
MVHERGSKPSPPDRSLNSKNADLENDAPASGRFFFIDPSNKDHRRQVRKHVMREHFRQKRQNVKAQSQPGQNQTSATPMVSKWRLHAGPSSIPQESRPDPNSRPSSKGSSTPSPPAEERKDSLDFQRPPTSSQIALRIGSVSSIHEADRFSARSSSEVYAEASPASARPFGGSLAQTRLPSPQSLLDGANVDPFDVLPMSLSLDEHSLVNHFVSTAPTVPSVPFYLHFRADAPFNPYRHLIFKLALLGPLSFEVGVLTFASIHRKCLLEFEGREADVLQVATTSSEARKARAVRLLQERIESPDSHNDDETIMATASMAACEVRFGDIQAGWNYLQAAMNMAKKRGGPTSMRKNPALEIYLHWVRITMPGYQPPDFLPNFASWPYRPIPPPNQGDEILEDVPRTLPEDLDILIRFIRNCEHLHLSQTPRSSRAEWSWRRTLFQPGTPIHRLLSCQPRFKLQVFARMTALMYFHVVLWDYRREDDRLEWFLSLVNKQVLENKLDQIAEVQMVIWVLMKLEYTPGIGRPQRPWTVERLLSLAKRMNHSSWERIEALLLRCLVVDDSPTEPNNFLLWEDDLRQEIMNAPATARIAPVLL